MDRGDKQRDGWEEQMDRWNEHMVGQIDRQISFGEYPKYYREKKKVVR